MSLGRGKQKKREILYLQPGGGEGVTLKVEEESDIGITTEQHEKLPYKHIKLNQGWDFPDAKRYLTVRGDIPITCYIEEDEEKEAPIQDFLKFVWGEAYDKIPDLLKEKLLDIGVTVRVKPLNISEDDERRLTPYLVFQTMREHFQNVLSGWARSKPKVDKFESLKGNILWLLVGGFGMYFLIKQGII